MAFSNVSFLKDVQKEARSRHRLRNLLILLMRLIAVASLVLGFADPMVAPTHSNKASTRQAVSIYIDTSPSMSAEGEIGPLIQEAKLKATALVEAFHESDRFHIFTSDFTGQDQRFLTQAEALERIAGVSLSHNVPMIEAVIQRSSDQFKRAGGADFKAFWVTDLQKSSHDVMNASVPDTSITWHVLPVVSNEVPNVWIDSVFFDAPVALNQQPASVHVRINHNSKESIEGLPLTLSVDGTTESIGSYPLVPGIPTDTILRFTHGQPGPHRLMVSLEDAPVTFDDAHHLGYSVAPAINVFHWTNMDEATRSISKKVDQAIQSGQPLLTLDKATSLPSPQLLAGYDFVIADALNTPSAGALDLLKQFVNGGGSVLVIPT